MPVLRPISSLKPIVPVGDSVHVSDLSSAVTIRIANGAMGIMFQAIDFDIYFAISASSALLANTQDFILNVEASTPSLLELEEGVYISFLEKDAGGKVTYQLVR